MYGNLRLASGLILTLFVVGHFINHALGIVSLRAMDEATSYLIKPWREFPGALILMAAVLVHVVLAIQALYVRRTLSMRWNDAAQLVTGFLIPVLIGAHVLSTRGLFEAFGIIEGYRFTLYGMWIHSIFYGVLNLIALPVVWFHTCLGWHYWLRLKRWYPAIRPYAFAFAIVLPSLALAGFASASLRVSRLSNNEQWVKRLFAKTSDQLELLQNFIATGEMIIWISVPTLIVLILVARFLRGLAGRRRSNARIKYSNLELSKQSDLALVRGTSLLDHFRLADIDHASVCGGRGRCSTCRVRIDSGLDDLPVAGDDERKVLSRINAGADVRLACQTYPQSSVAVTALLGPDSGAARSTVGERSKSGEEQEIAVLFADIRGFTKLSEAKLPYDVAFLLNRYFAAMGRAIEDSGGHLDKFIGDGVMALFGVDEPVEEGCKKALRAAAGMSKQLEVLNETMKSDLSQNLRIGIGIHSGTAIVGDMGYKKTVGLTAIGDVVNTASRLESLTKEYGAQLIVSETTLKNAGIGGAGMKRESAAIRGREEPLGICVFTSARDLEGSMKSDLELS
ncbi:MAG: adenylate/guanylate cyclase domain-containing protein [Pseudomonadota bacterium]